MGVIGVMGNMNDYETVARVIRYLDTHRAEQPSVSTLAAEVGLSESHFHRLFARWAGITPKDFLQVLTLNHAKAALRRGESVLSTALEAGLSGPGRLHDLFVSLEAASPGEWKSGGMAWEIVAGYGDTPFGKCLIAESPRGICHLSFVDEQTDATACWRELCETWYAAEITRDDAWAGKLAAQIFLSGAAPNARLRAVVCGTPFQVRVWRALLSVPPGELTSYGRIAKSMGIPSAARAVGSSVASNNLAYIIPCHRVIRETGVIGQYRWGDVRKKAMLAYETLKTANAP